VIAIRTRENACPQIHRKLARRNRVLISSWLPSNDTNNSSPTVLKDESEVAVAATFEEIASQLSDTEPAMHMRLAKTIAPVA